MLACPFAGILFHFLLEGGVCARAWACGRQRTTSGVVLQEPSSVSWVSVSHWVSLIQLAWLQQIQESACVHLPSVWIRSVLLFLSLHVVHSCSCATVAGLCQLSHVPRLESFPFFVFIFYFSFVDRISPCSPSLKHTAILLPQPPQWLGYRHELPHSACVTFRLKHLTANQCCWFLIGVDLSLFYFYFCVCIMPCECRDPQRPEEGMRYPGAGVTVSCELPHAGAGKPILGLLKNSKSS